MICATPPPDSLALNLDRLTPRASAGTGAARHGRLHASFDVGRPRAVAYLT